MGLLDRLTSKRPEPETHQRSAGAAEQSLFATKALGTFLRVLTLREAPVLLDLGPVVGPNVGFFGEHLGCKIFVDDVCAEIERHVRANTLADLPEAIGARCSHADASVDGILAWDVFDYLDKASAHVLGRELTRILRPDGALLGFFGNVPPKEQPSTYTKYVIVDESTLRHRPYPGARERQPVLATRDIIRLFDGLRVSDSFFMKNNVREILFRKT
ncbi:MAG: class I SAM-dependent methyltransferase [Acidobacteriaceae bacterium]|jgi:hypothetical protein|nr:class I SAM-dependent methyltransferase [Acidobacteriaceae bacterium]